jgi:pimeloyl-ACP methyl ester carboxylesterase
MLPVASYGPNARERLPQAKFEILPHVGHDPMMDDPSLVARTILACTGTANN